MRLYSTHCHPPGTRHAGRRPVLVKEGFSWPCLFLGWFGLLLSGAWIAGLLAGALGIALAALLQPWLGTWNLWAVLAGWRLLLALFANDLRRWELGLRGLQAGPPVAGRDADTALVRLLDQRPDLSAGLMAGAR